MILFYITIRRHIIKQVITILKFNIKRLTFDVLEK